MEIKMGSPLATSMLFCVIHFVLLCMCFYVHMGYMFRFPVIIKENGYIFLNLFGKLHHSSENIR